MNEQELEALKTSNPAAHTLIVSMRQEKADAETKSKAEADRKKAEDDLKLKPKPEDDLQQKALKEKEAGQDKVKEMTRIEGALRFNMSANQFVKDNEDLLPAEVSSILRVSEKEVYDNALQRANAVKAAFVKSFFAIEDNVGALTANQKVQLDDYLKLTKNGKEDKANEIYENLFEPALETMRKVKKAEQVGLARNGFAGTNQVEDAYKQRLINQAKQAHLGEKGK